MPDGICPVSPVALVGPARIRTKPSSLGKTSTFPSGGPVAWGMPGCWGGPGELEKDASVVGERGIVGVGVGGGGNEGDGPSFAEASAGKGDMGVDVGEELFSVVCCMLSVV